MTTFRQIADQKIQTPRNRTEAAALAKVALAYLGVVNAHIDAAIARCETDTLAAYDAACAPVSKSTAKRIAALSSGGTHWDECWRDHHECAIARVEELERTLSAYRQAITEAKARNTGQIGANYGPDWILSYARELLKEQPHD